MPTNTVHLALAPGQVTAVSSNRNVTQLRTPRPNAAPRCPWRLALGLALLLGFTIARPTASRGADTNHLAAFVLQDQFGTNHTVSFPRARPLILLLGDRRGSEEVDAWIAPLKQRWDGVADLLGIADVSAAPRFLRNRIREALRKQRPHPLMLDFDGSVTDPLHCLPKTANLLVVAPDGRIVARESGPPDDSKFLRIGKALGTKP